MKKFIALFLIFSIISLYGNLYAKERRGADLVIQKIDGQQVRGELIAVKRNSLLLKESNSGLDVSVDVKDVIVISINKKSKTLVGVGLGFLAGAAVGAIVGLVVDEIVGKRDLFWGPQHSALLGGGIGGFAGGVAGGLIGSNRSKTIQIEGKSEAEIKKILEDLRKKARVPDFQ